MRNIIKYKNEVFFIVSFFVITAVINATSLILEDIDDGIIRPEWHHFVTEFSSAFSVLMLLPFILWIDHRYPIASRSWPKRLLLHVPLSMIFSFVHVVSMVAIRKVIFSLMDDFYEFTEIWYAVLYEYRKDAGTYFIIIVSIYAYREIMRLRRGEAQIEQAEEKRIMVSKAGVFKFIDPQSIDWVEAAGNYVELHVGDNTYMLRSTMKDIGARLGNKDFARIHRSTIVRKNQVEGLEPAMNGDKYLNLKNGVSLRMSRRYKANLEI